MSDSTTQSEWIPTLSPVAEARELIADCTDDSGALHRESLHRAITDLRAAIEAIVVQFKQSAAMSRERRGTITIAQGEAEWVKAQTSAEIWDLAARCLLAAIREAEAAPKE